MCCPATGDDVQVSYLRERVRTVLLGMTVLDRAVEVCHKECWCFDGVLGENEEPKRTSGFKTQ